MTILFSSSDAFTPKRYDLQQYWENSWFTFKDPVWTGTVLLNVFPAFSSSQKQVEESFSEGEVYSLPKLYTGIQK